MSNNKLRLSFHGDPWPSRPRSQPAHRPFADYVLQTATAGTLGSSGSYVATGDGTDAGSSFIGTTFTLNSSTNTLQVGGNFDTNGIGSAFAEVVSLSSLTASGLLKWNGHGQ